MESQIEKISAVECRVRVAIPWDDVSPRLAEKMRDLRRKARIPGFRPGKVPPKMLERLYGKSVRDELARDLVQETFETAVVQHKKTALTQPVVESTDMADGQAFNYAARFEVLPEIEPKDYEGLEVRRRPAKVADEQVDETIEAKRKELTEIQPLPEDIDREGTEAGDLWTLDVDGTLGDDPVGRRDLQVEIGNEENEFIPGLGAQLAELKLAEVGSTKDVSFMPTQEKLKPEFRDKEAQLKLALREVRQKVIPELDDEFARDTGEAESLQELREKTSAKLLEEDGIEAEREARERLVHKILENNTIEPAPSMVTREAEAQVELFRRQLAQQGLSFEQVGASRAQLLERARDEARYKVSAFLLLDAIGKKHELDVAEDEVEAELKEMAEAQGKNVARLRATMEKNNELLLLRAQMREEKILDYLMEKSTVTEAPDPEPEPDGGAEGEKDS